MNDLSPTLAGHPGVDEAHGAAFAPGVPRNPLVAARKMVVDKVETNKRTRLSWSDRTKYQTPGDPVNPPHPVGQDPTRIIGRLDKRLAFMGPFFGYWIQNGQVLKGNGQPVRLESIPEFVKNVWIDTVTRLPVQGDPFPLRDTVKAALDVWRAQAVQSDPLMCPICFATNGDPVTFSAHLYKAHRSELAEAAGETDLEAAAATGPAPIEAPKSRKTTPTAQP